METADIWEPEGDNDGYLTQAYLDALGAAKFASFSEAGRYLTETFPAAVDLMACASIDVSDGLDFLEKPVRRISFSTGGWSGAEDLIGTMLKHHAIEYMHTQWKRGGHYVFEVPALPPGKG